MKSEKKIKALMQQALKDDLDKENMELDVIARYFQLRALNMVLEGED